MAQQTTASSERMMEEVRIVTGEAVLLDAAPASAAARMLSGLIDYGLTTIGLILSIITLLAVRPVSTSGPDPLVMIAFSLLMLGWIVLLPLTVEVASRGSSIGRWVMGLRVVRDDGGTVSLRHCLVRVLVGVVEIYAALSILAIASCTVTRRGKRLGDLLAGTYVVRDQLEAATAPPILMPPELASWAEQTDLRALPGNLALVARTFLQRASGPPPASSRPTAGSAPSSPRASRPASRPRRRRARIRRGSSRRCWRSAGTASSRWRCATARWPRRPVPRWRSCPTASAANQAPPPPHSPSL